MSRGRVSLPVTMAASAIIAATAVFLAFAVGNRHGRSPVIVTMDPTLVGVVVEVRGAVVRPGVYTLPEDGRVGQLVELAGGVSPDADLRQLNLARRLEDEELVVIPSLTAATPLAATVEPSGERVGISRPDGRLDLNTASAAELEELPGIGEVLALRIVAYRETNGPFQRVEDLDAIDGISAGVIAGLRDLVTVGP